MNKPLNPKKDPRFGNSGATEQKVEMNVNVKKEQSKAKEKTKEEEPSGHEGAAEAENTMKVSKGLIVLTQKHLTSIIDNITKKTITEVRKSTAKVAPRKEEAKEKKEEKEEDTVSLYYDGDENENDQENIDPGNKVEQVMENDKQAMETGKDNQKEEKGITNIHQEILDW